MCPAGGGGRRGSGRRGKAICRVAAASPLAPAAPLEAEHCPPVAPCPPWSSPSLHSPPRTKSPTLSCPLRMPFCACALGRRGERGHGPWWRGRGGITGGHGHGVQCVGGGGGGMHAVTSNMLLLLPCLIPPRLHNCPTPAITAHTCCVQAPPPHHHHSVLSLTARTHSSALTLLLTFLPWLPCRPWLFESTD